MSLRRSLLAGVFAAVAATATLSLAQTPSIPFGTILGVTAGDGLTGGGTIGNVTLTQYTGVNPQLGTTYTVLSTDRAKLLTFSNLSSVAVTLPTATGTFGAGFAFWASCYGPGTCTLTPTSGNINGGVSLSILSGNAAYVVSDGGNWQSAVIGSAGGAGVTLTGNVTGSGLTTITTTVVAVNSVNYPSSVLAPIGTMPFVTATGQVTYVSPYVLITPGSLGLGTMALQNANAVVITGGSAVGLTTLTATLLSATNLVAANATLTTLTATNVSATNATVTTLTATNLSATNATMATLTATRLNNGFLTFSPSASLSIVSNTTLEPILTSRVMGNASAATAMPSPITASSILDFISSSTGALLTRGVSVWGAITPATSGTVPMSSGTGSTISFQPLPADIAWIAGYDSTMTPTSLAVQGYGAIAVPRTSTILGEVAKLQTAATPSALILDVLKNGTTIYSSKPQFAAASTTLTLGTLATSTLVPGDRLLFIVTQKGSTTAGAGLDFTLKVSVP